MKQLGINPAMDKMARDNGLGHWSCVDPINGELWLRSDGVTTKKSPAIFLNGGYDYKSVLDWLEHLDVIKPIGKDWQQPETDLPEKVIVSNGCHDCVLLEYRDCVCSITKVDVLPFILDATRNPDCSLLTHTIKVVKNDK